MSKLSLAAVKNSICKAKNVAELFSREFINGLAKSLGLSRRRRRLDFGSVVCASIAVMSSLTKERCLKISAIRDKVIELFGIRTSEKCFHQYLDKPVALTELGKRLVAEALAKVAKKLSGQAEYIQAKELLRQLLDKFKLDDIILFDGTEIALRKGCALNFACERSSKGRPGKNGEPARPTLKLHVAYSVLRNTIVYIEITEGCSSERAEVFPDRFKNCLLIMDRGYVSAELEKKIEESGNYFLIKGKSDSAGEILAACDGNGNKLEDLAGKDVQDALDKMDDLKYLDLDVKRRGKKNKDSFRLVIARNEGRDAKKNKLVFLRTNLPRELCSCFQVHQIYRTRWLVEIFMKTLKSGCCLQSINSDKEHIILFFVCLSVFISIMKTYFGACAAKAQKGLRISMLKLHQLAAFAGAFVSFFTCKRSAFFAHKKRLLELIQTCCERTAPAKEDRENLKDQYVLFKSVIDDCPAIAFWP